MNSQVQNPKKLIKVFNPVPKSGAYVQSKNFTLDEEPLQSSATASRPSLKQNIDSNKERQENSTSSPNLMMHSVSLKKKIGTLQTGAQSAANNSQYISLEKPQIAAIRQHGKSNKEIVKTKEAACDQSNLAFNDSHNVYRNINKNEITIQDFLGQQEKDESALGTLIKGNSMAISKGPTQDAQSVGLSDPDKIVSPSRTMLHLNEQVTDTMRNSNDIVPSEPYSEDMNKISSKRTNMSLTAYQTRQTQNYMSKRKTSERAKYSHKPVHASNIVLNEQNQIQDILTISNSRPIVKAAVSVNTINNTNINKFKPSSVR